MNQSQEFASNEVIIQEDTYKILSYQSKEVLNIILNEGIYTCDKEKTRERRDYQLDTEQLGGYNPVWGFLIPTNKGLDIYYEGALLETHRCEMSTKYDKLKEGIILELNIQKELVRKGKTHNSYDYAVVFPFIKKENLNKVYYLKEVLPSKFKYGLPLMEVCQYIDIKNKYTPIFENKFRFLTNDEYDKFEHLLLKEIPLKYIEVDREYKTENEVEFITKEI